MPIEANIHEAKTHFSELIAKVLAGERVIIARAGKPVAELIPYRERGAPRRPGSARGQVVIGPDFDAPLPEDILTAAG